MKKKLLLFSLALFSLITIFSYRAFAKSNRVAPKQESVVAINARQGLFFQDNSGRTTLTFIDVAQTALACQGLHSAENIYLTSFAQSWDKGKGYLTYIKGTQSSDSLPLKLHNPRYNKLYDTLVFDIEKLGVTPPKDTLKEPVLLLSFHL